MCIPCERPIYYEPKVRMRVFCGYCPSIKFEITSLPRAALLSADVHGYSFSFREFKTSKGACVFSILTQDASEALNLIFQLSVLVLLTIILVHRSLTRLRLLKKIRNGETCWGAFI